MNARDAYSTKELAELLHVTPKNLLARAEKEGWQSQPRAKKLGGDLWLVNERMPEVTRAAIGAALAERMAALPAPAGPVLPAAGQAYSDIAIPEYAYNKARARFRVVAAWRKHAAEAKKKGVAIRPATDDFLSLYNAGLALPRSVTDVIGAVSLPTLYLWAKKLKENNEDMEALADKRGGWLYGKPKGAGQIGDDAAQAFLAVYLKPNQPTRAFAYNCMKSHLEGRGLKVPSYSGVCRFFERFDAANHDLVVWMREGEKAYRDKVGKFLSRDDSILRVGDVLVADGHKMNFLIINPETGKPCRMTLIGWQDWASTLFMGFDIMVAENTQAISVSLFNSIAHLGKYPGAVYIDNGKAFKNKFFSGDADLEDFDGLYARLGITVMHSKPYEARTKIIERWWRDFDQQFAVGLPSYIGRDIEHKPAHMRRGEDWHRALQAKAAHIPTLEEVKRKIIEFAMWKAQQPHPSRPDTTPWEVFQAGRGPGFEKGEVEAMSRHFLHRRAIHPKRCRFTMMGVEFEADALHGLNMQLTAHYSHSDLSQVYVYDKERLLCVARPVASVHPMARLYGDDLDVATLKAAQKQQAALKANTQKQATALSARGMATDVLESLPWMRPGYERKAPLLVHQGGKALEAAAETELSEAERAELLALEERIRAEEKAAPEYEVPFFSSERERYEYFFDLETMEGKTLLPEDEAWMREYERGPGYAASAGRYEKLRAMLAEQKGVAAL